MTTRELTDSDIQKAELQASDAETELAALIIEAEGDAAEVAKTLSELRVRLEEVVRGGATGLDDVIDDVRHASAPTLPVDRHRARVLEARADAMRARLWVVSAMKDDLKRFSLELADAVRIAETARGALDRHAEAPRVNITRRFERIRTVTADLSSRPDINGESHPRRQQPRVRLETAIDLHSTSNFFTGFSENISDGGVFVATELDLPVATEVEIAFTLPDGVEIRGRGNIRWVRKASSEAAAGVGVQFINLSGAARDAVQNFLAMREPLFHTE